MKKQLLAMISVLLVIVLTACGQADNGETANDTTNHKVEETNENETANQEESKDSKEAQPEVYPQFSPVSESEKVAVIKTSMGDIKIKLFPQYAPKTVENFVTHSQNGYYDGVIFHRVIEDFMIQTGDPQGNGTGGESIWGESFEDEFVPELGNYRGALSMANRGPNTNGSQFFIVQMKELPDGMVDQMQSAGFSEQTIENYKEHGGTPWLDFKHTVFGHVIEGMDIVDSIATVEKGPNDKPVEDIVIKSIEIQ
jgi:peptidyl-prolyl cis-trans isomerase B (cyclophilin B)